MNQKRLFLGAVLGAVLLTSCGSADVAAVTDGSSPQSETTIPESPPQTSATAGDPAELPPTTVADEPTPSDRMVAPDFTLELGTGGTFTLSEGDKPVYLVFWAEW